MGLDIARGLAVIGMIGAHMGSTPDLMWSDPQTWAGVVHGRSAILFAVLAGVSIALVTGRTVPPAPEELPGVRLRLIGRGAAIFAIGVALELLGTGVAVILTFYGVLYVAAIPVLRWSPRRLFLAAAGLALLGPPVLAAIQLLSLYATGPGTDLVVSGVYPITVWLVFVLVGLGLGRLGVDRMRIAVVSLLAGVVLAALGYGLGAAAEHIVDGEPGDSAWSSSSSFASLEDGTWGVPADEVDLDGYVCDVEEEWVGCYPEETGSSSVDEEMWEELSYWEQLRDSDPWKSLLWSTISVQPHSGGIPEIVGSGGFALAALGGCLLLARPGRWLLIPLAALGSMPLTAYAAHVVIILVVGGGPMGFVNSNATWGWSTLGLLIATTVWALLWGRGPLERLVGRSAGAMAAPRGVEGVRPD